MKKSREMREEVTKIVNLNKKCCEEVKKLKEENEELKQALQEREIEVGKMKVSDRGSQKLERRERTTTKDEFGEDNKTTATGTQ